MSTEFDKNISDWRYDCTDHKNGFEFFMRLVKWPKIAIKKSQNLIFKVNFNVKNHSNLSNFFFTEEYQLGRRFFVIVIFLKTSILEPLCFLKWCPIFDGPCEHLWKSNQKIIFILLIFLLKSTPCWLTTPPLRSH